MNNKNYATKLIDISISSNKKNILNNINYIFLTFRKDKNNNYKVDSSDNLISKDEIKEINSFLQKNNKQWSAQETVYYCNTKILSGVPIILIYLSNTTNKKAYDFQPSDNYILKESIANATRNLIKDMQKDIDLLILSQIDNKLSIQNIYKGVQLGAYKFNLYLTNNNKYKLSALIFSNNIELSKDSKMIKRAENECSSIYVSRDLINTPANDLTPKKFAKYISNDLTSIKNLKCNILDKEELTKKGYNGILGVGQGSVNEPVLVHLQYKGAKSGPTVALVGKGITYDSGGLSLKPSNAMISMKCDMSGAAAAYAITRTIALSNININIDCWLPIAENMLSGSSIRPSDIVKIYNNKTVEINNTDAEGRIILADALSRASEDKPEYIIDIATLTGAMVVALGEKTIGVVSNNNKLKEIITKSAKHVDEKLWHMPLVEELQFHYKSNIADLSNCHLTNRYAGGISAATFLYNFIDNDIKWAHFDIAGPAFNDSSPHGSTPSGGTGSAIATIIELCNQLSTKEEL